MPLSPGDVFAGYTLERQLGSGGMGTVFLARHPRLPRSDALKLLRPELSDDQSFAARFVREADLLARLDHPNIVPVLDRGADGGQLWLSMRYVPGLDAEEALEAAGGALPAERAVHIVRGVAAALDFAHRHGLVHRDVKPANILLAPSADDDEPEHVFLTDFGIAKAADSVSRLTSTGAVVATFDYAAPEQIESRTVDHRTDIYALGCLLHKLLTGSVAFPGHSLAAPIHGHLTLPPPRPTALCPWLPPGLDDVVARAMAKSPEDRFPSCRALAQAAADALTHYPEAPGLPYRVRLHGHPAGAPTRPELVPTDVLPAAEQDRMADLVRRTRFFELPDQLIAADAGESAGPAPEGSATIEIAAGGRLKRVSYDPSRDRRPPELDELAELVDRTVREPAPPTVHQRPPPAPDPAPPVPAPAPEPPPRPHRRSRVPLLIGAAVLTAVAAVSVLLAVRDPDPGGTPGGTVASSTSAPSASVTSAATTAPTDLPPVLAALPRSSPLLDETLVAPRTIDGNTDLFLVDAYSGATTTHLTTSPADEVAPIISPDRQTVIYLQQTESGDTLRVVAADSTGDRALFAGPPPGCASVLRPAWNPADPTQLALVCIGADGRHSLRVIVVDGAVVRQLDVGFDLLDDVSFSPDGTTIVFWAKGRTDPGGAGLFSVAADGGAAPARLTGGGQDDDGDAVWAPDGELIAFRRCEVGTDPLVCDIHVMNRDGSGVRVLAAAPGVDQDPTWSPDGKRIAFKSNRAGPSAVAGNHIWRMAADGSDLVQLESGGSGVDDSAPAWGHR